MKHETPAEAGASLLEQAVGPAGNEGSTGSWRFDGYSPHPTPDGRCERPKLLRNDASGEVLITWCGSPRVEVCAPCSKRYQRRVQQVAFRGVLLPGRVYLVTLTAPSDKGQHSYRGLTCPCTPAGGIDLAQWNGRAAERWNRFQWDWKRSAGIDFEYFRGVEAQQRGALHFHVLIRVTQGRKISKARLRRLAMHHGFGHEVDIQPVGHGEALEEKLVEAPRAAHYPAKYCTKAASERQAVPYVHPTTGEIGPGRWRTWTCSRRWGSSMRQVKRDQLEYWRRQRREADERSGSDVGRMAPQAPLDSNHPSYAEVPLPNLAAGELEPM